MASSVTYNRNVIKNKTLLFQMKVREGNDYVDISSWQFNFKLLNASSVVIWDIVNSEFTRADNFTISFQKFVSDLAHVIDGLYTISLFITNSDMVNNEIINGQWNFSD